MAFNPEPIDELMGYEWCGEGKILKLKTLKYTF